MHVNDCLPLDQIFSFLQDPTPDHPLGWEMHFNTTRMYAYAREIADRHDEHPDVEGIETTIDADHIQHLIQRKNVDLYYALGLSQERLDDPVLSILMPDGSTLLVDGHHRLVGRFLRRLTHYQLYRVTQPAWENFLVNIPHENRAVSLEDFLNKPGRSFAVVR